MRRQHSLTRTRTRKMTTTTETANDDATGTESTTVFSVVLVDDDNVDTVGRRRVVGRLGEHQKRVRDDKGHRRGPITYGSTVDGEVDEDHDDYHHVDDEDEDDDDLGLLLSSKEERRRTTRGARALATVGVAALAASGCGRALAAVRESGTPTMRSGYDKDNVALRSVSGWDAATANQLASNFGRVGSRAALRRQARGASI